MSDHPTDPAQDPWLQAALRHAPDADAAPPPALSAAILRQARAAAAPAAPSFGQRLIDAWGWLVSPPVATGLASLMVLTVAGLMGWDRPLDEALPPRDAPVTVAQAPAAQPAPAAAPAAESVAAPRAAVPVPSAAPAPTPAPEPAPAPPVAAKAAAPQEPRRELEGLGAARRVLPGAPKVPTAPTSLADAEVDTAPEAVARQAPAAPLAAAGRATDRAADTAGAAAVEAAAAPPERSAAAHRGLASAASGPATMARALAARPDPAPGSAQPLKELRFAAAQHPDLWRWQRGTEPARAVDAATLTWLDQLDQAAPWRPAAAPAPAAGTDATLLSWYRNGQLYARLQLQAGGAHYELQRNPAVRWRADLSADQAAALLGALDTALSPAPK